LTAFDTAMRNYVLKGSLVRVKLWRADGSIVYSDEPRLIGRTFDLGEDESAALAAGSIDAEISDLTVRRTSTSSPSESCSRSTPESPRATARSCSSRPTSDTTPW
jgi:hypothetical protein